VVTRRAAPWSIYFPGICVSALRRTGRWRPPITFRGPRRVRPYHRGSHLDQPGVCEQVFHDTGTHPPGPVQELENQLYRAAETYRRFCRWRAISLGRAPTTRLGLARIYYEWNDLDAAEQYAQQSLQLARQYDRCDRQIHYREVFLARLKLARGDVAGAAAMLAETEQSVRQNEFVQRRPEVAAAQVLTLLRQGDVAAAARLVAAYDLPASQARVFLAQGETAKAVALLASIAPADGSQGLAG
jgi:LuxR family transcriptional regulator, maltose regulon positive regulatory protein